MPYTQVNLADLPAPQIVREIDYETILRGMKDACVRLRPDMAPVLEVESEPAVKVLQVCAAYAMMLRAQINDAARSLLLAYASGSDLDHLAALFGVERATFVDATLDAPAVMEDDANFRIRVQLSLEGFSSAGPRGAYEFHARSADGRVKDIAVVGPGDPALAVPPGTVRIFVLSTAGDGTADASLLGAVSAAVNAENVRPLTDTVIVESAIIQPFPVTAQLEVKAGPDRSIILQSAQSQLAAYLSEVHAIGAKVALSGIHAALHVPGVERVIVTNPAGDIVPPPHVAPFASATNITLAE